MGDFKSLDEIAEEMQQQKEKPWLDEQGRDLRQPSVDEVNQETARLRRLARETQAAQETPQDTPQETPVGFPHADAKLLSNGDLTPATAENVAEQQPLEKAKPPSFDTAKYLSIAAHCQVSRQHISYIMSGDRDPSTGVLNKMADYFKMPMDELYTRLEKIKNIPEVWLG